MCLRRLFVCLVFSLLACFTAWGQAGKRRVIIDTDPGTDDALAILLALNSPELQVEAISVVPGNVDGKQGLENALKLASVAGRCDIPVTAGAQHPLMQKLYTAQYWHGNNGLADLQLPASKCKADPRFGPDLIIELVHKYPHEITLVPVGPLTNIALAVSKDPSIVELVNDIVIGCRGAHVDDEEASQGTRGASWTAKRCGYGNREILYRTVGEEWLGRGGHV